MAVAVVHSVVHVWVNDAHVSSVRGLVWPWLWCTPWDTRGSSYQEG